MFFHRIERLNNKTTIKEKMKKALEDQYYTIILLVNPDRSAGKFLMDQKQSAVISDYSGTNVNIFYTSEGLRSEFPQFIDHILLEVRNMSGEEVKEPGLLIFFPKKEQLVTLELADEDDIRKFRSFLFMVIDALELPVRPVTHSITFAILAALSGLLLTGKKLVSWTLLAALTSHIIRDAAGGGTPIFLPLEIYRIPSWLYYGIEIVLLYFSFQVSRLQGYDQ